MWKAIAVATVTALTVSIAPMSPAQAEGACEFSVPERPNECLSQAMYEYVTTLTADDLAQRVRASAAEADAYQLRQQMWQMGTDLVAARQATSIAIGQRDVALDQLDLVNRTVEALRAKVRVLKKRIKKLEAQLPYSAA